MSASQSGLSIKIAGTAASKRTHRKVDMVRVLNCLGIATLIVLGTRSVQATVVASYFLDGQNPMSGNAQGTFDNPTHIFPFSGTNTTSATLNYFGDFKIHLKTSSVVQNTTISGGNLEEASATLSVATTGQMAGTAPFPASLTYIGSLTGTVTVGTNSFNDGSLNFGSVAIDTLGDLFFPDIGTYPINIPLTTTVPVSATGSYPVNFSMHSESWGRVGTTSGDFQNTLELSQILLPDGHTPESEGWTLSFSDGSKSPNIPEPSTLILAALGGLALLTWRRWRP